MWQGAKETAIRARKPKLGRLIVPREFHWKLGKAMALNANENVASTAYTPFSRSFASHEYSAVKFQRDNRTMTRLKMYL
jgi:hypothetical protein